MAQVREFSLMEPNTFERTLFEGVGGLGRGRGYFK